jgi:hypothetical protein
VSDCKELPSAQAKEKKNSRKMSICMSWKEVDLFPENIIPQVLEGGWNFHEARMQLI